MSDWTFKYNFNKTKFISQLEKQIKQSTEGSPELRKEIRRVFQVANRRIQNIQNSDVFSPAIASLGKKNDVQGYSKFTVKGFQNTGNDWKSLKKEYAKALAFLNQPTSTLKGAKQFDKQVKTKFESKLNVKLSNEEWTKMREPFMTRLQGVSGELLQALPYADQVQSYYQEMTASVSSQIENESKTLEIQAQQRIDEFSKNMAEQTAEGVEDWLEWIKDSFKI